jgi:hypothetical protein
VRAQKAQPAGFHSLETAIVSQMADITGGELSKVSTF